MEEKRYQSTSISSEVADNYAKNDSKGEFASTLLNIAANNDANDLRLDQSISGDLMDQNKNDNFVKLETNHSEIAGNVLKKENVLVKNLESVSNFSNSDNDFKCKQYKTERKNCEKLSEAVVKVVKPLCADYRSDSDSESVDSESDSSTLSTVSTDDTSSETEDDSDNSHDSVVGKKITKTQKEKSKSDLTLLNLPPIEDLKISVPETACVDIGTITNIVDVLVVVESYKGTAALDLDTVLFLDHGKRTLGKVFDVLGPISEPIYTIRFNSREQINDCNVKKGLKVYFAPRTEHTNFVFMSEVLKNKGTDASWKDNAEAPPEFQDFSDDEEEKWYKSKQCKDFYEKSSDLTELSNSRKRSFSEGKQSPGVLKASKFRNSNCLQRAPDFQRNSFSSSSRPNPPNFTQPAPFSHNPSIFPPHMHSVPRFSGPPFPSFGFPPYGNQNENFRRPFYQPRVHPFNQGFGPWGRPPFRPFLPPGPFPPPPPPPPPPPVKEF